MSNAAVTARFRAQGADEAAALVREQCIHLPEPEKAATFGPFFDRFADARVVLLGEATHGTSEFYNARAAITQRLITDHGFNIVAVEADWVRSIRDACGRQNVPFFFKQWGKYGEEGQELKGKATKAKAKIDGVVHNNWPEQTKADTLDETGE